MILSFLGTGDYKEATYQWADHPPIRTRLFVAALAAWFPDEPVQVLCSTTARALRGELLMTHLPNATALDIHDGGSDEEHWDLFQTICDAVPQGSTVIFDVTHGFRTMPLVCILTLAYLRAVRNVTVRHVLYGAYDRDRPITEHTPAFDLTAFLRLLDWAEGAGRFRDTGDARKITQLITENRQSPLNKTARLMKQVSEGLSYNRTLEVGETATALLAALEQAQAQEMTRPHHRPFQLLAEELEATVRPLAVPPNPSGLALLQALHRRVVWYADRDHHVQAISLAREWLVQAYIWFSTGDVDLSVNAQSDASHALGAYRKVGERKVAKPKLKGMEENQESEEDRAKRVLREKKKELSVEEDELARRNYRPPTPELLDLWERLTDRRNDLAHHGMRVDKRVGTERLRDESRRSVSTSSDAGSSLIGALQPVARSLGIDL
jgi:CRISPR-associated DxTHG motif protein